MYILAGKEWTKNLNTTILGLFYLNFATSRIENQTDALFTFWFRSSKINNESDWLKFWRQQNSSKKRCRIMVMRSWVRSLAAKIHLQKKKPHLNSFWFLQILRKTKITVLLKEPIFHTKCHKVQGCGTRNSATTPLQL